MAEVDVLVLDDTLELLESLVELLLPELLVVELGVEVDVGVEVVLVVWVAEVEVVLAAAMLALAVATTALIPSVLRMPSPRVANHTLRLPACREITIRTVFLSVLR